MEITVGSCALAFRGFMWGLWIKFRENRGSACEIATHPRGQGRATSPTAVPWGGTGTGQGADSQGPLAPGNVPAEEPTKHNQNRDSRFLLIQEKKPEISFLPFH